MFNIGQRVRISKDYTWAQNALGTIAYPPYSIIDYDIKGYARFVTGVKGSILFYYVEFDTPHCDADGDGPYRGAEIAEDDLTLIFDPR